MLISPEGRDGHRTPGSGTGLPGLILDLWTCAVRCTAGQLRLCVSRGWQVHREADAGQEENAALGVCGFSEEWGRPIDKGQ